VQEETDYLLDLCDRFDLRFAIIADRYAPPRGQKRTVEDLKERYYALALELTRARAGDAVLASNLPFVRNPYDAQKERERKEFLAMTLSRTPAQVWLRACSGKCRSEPLLCTHSHTF
jgi:DNA methyltransferase 1-associated protein 1